MEPPETQMEAIAHLYQDSRKVARTLAMEAYKLHGTRATWAELKLLLDTYGELLSQRKGNRDLATKLLIDFGRQREIEGDALLELVADFTEWLAAYFYLQEGMFRGMQQRRQQAASD